MVFFSPEIQQQLCENHCASYTLNSDQIRNRIRSHCAKTSPIKSVCGVHVMCPMDNTFVTYIRARINSRQPRSWKDKRKNVATLDTNEKFTWEQTDVFCYTKQFGYKKKECFPAIMENFKSRYCCPLQLSQETVARHIISDTLIKIVP